MESGEVFAFVILGIIIIVAFLRAVDLEHKADEPDNTDVVHLDDLISVALLAPADHFAMDVYRQSGNKYREQTHIYKSGQQVADSLLLDPSKAINEVLKTFRRAKISTVVIEENTATKLSFRRLYHDHRGVKEGRKVGWACILGERLETDFIEEIADEPKEGSGDVEQISVVLKCDDAEITLWNLKYEHMMMSLTPKKSPYYRDDTIEVNIKLDSEDIVQINAYDQGVAGTIFFPWEKVNSLLRKMLKSKAMSIEFESYDSDKEIVEFGSIEDLSIIAQPLFEKMGWDYFSDSDLLADTLNNLNHELQADVTIEGQKILAPIRLSAYQEYYKEIGVSETIHNAIKLVIEVASAIYEDFRLNIQVVGDTSNTPDSLTDSQILLKLEKELKSESFDHSLINKISTTKRAPELYTSRDGYPALIGEVKTHANALEISILTEQIKT